MDKVFIEGLSLQGKHGVMTHERHTEQEFVLDISAEFDTRAASASDVLTDTVDYVVFRDIAQSVVEQNSFYLIEKLGDQIAQKILADDRIASVTITIRKPAVLKNGIPGITITRARV